MLLTSSPAIVPPSVDESLGASLSGFELGDAEFDDLLLGDHRSERLRVHRVREMPNALLQLLTAMMDVLVAAPQTHQLHRRFEVLLRAQLTPFVACCGSGASATTCSFATPSTRTKMPGSTSVHSSPSSAA